MSAEKCTATNRQGNRCGNAPVPGTRVCRMHGGAAPQVRRAGEIRAARMEAHSVAERMVARAGVDVDPIEHLLESLHRAAALVEVWGAMVAALDWHAEQQVAEQDGLRGELGYMEADPEDRDELYPITPRDSLLALDRHGMAQVHPYVAEYQTAIERRAKMAKLCIDAGVAERQVRLMEHQGQLIAQAIRGILGDLGVADHPEVATVVRRHLTLVSSQRAG